MTNETGDAGTRCQELFITDLLFGLTPEEQLEYESLGAAASEVDLQSLADIISLLDEARAVSDLARLPVALQERIRHRARNEFVQAAPTKPRRRFTRSKTLMPWVIAAACLFVASAVIVRNGWPPRTNREAPAELRERLIASSPNLIRADWSAGPTPVSGASGDIAWSTDEQRGYMRFQGMRVNDPGVEQYQLWIFDRNQDEKTPIDGGVFDVPSSGEIVVPIRPALHVRDPYLFAVTVEKPGGVVVSDRRRLPLLAAVSK
jgi:anti-sigma-K factor RskA